MKFTYVCAHGIFACEFGISILGGTLLIFEWSGFDYCCFCCLFVVKLMYYLLGIEVLEV